MGKQEVEQVEKQLSDKGECTVEADGKEFRLTKEMMSGVKRYQKKVHVEEFTPSVVEPSFGIGRIMYAVFEHNFAVRKVGIIKFDFFCTRNDLKFDYAGRRMSREGTSPFLRALHPSSAQCCHSLETRNSYLL